MRNLIKRFFSAVADSVGGGVSRATSADTGKKKYVGIGSLTYLCSKIKSALSLKFDKSNIVQNATTAATDKVPSAAVAKNLQDQLNALNTKINGEKRLYEFIEVQPNEWTSLVIPHKLGKKPNFVLATPYSASSGRIYWKTLADETNITIRIYNEESTSFSVGFYVLCTAP